MKNFSGQSSALPQMPLVFGCLLLQPGHVSTLVTHGKSDLEQPRLTKSATTLVQIFPRPLSWENNF